MLVVLAVIALMMLSMPSPSLAEDGGVDPRLPADLYKSGSPHPEVVFANATIEEGTNGSLTITVSFPGFGDVDDVTVELELYGWATYGVEMAYSEVTGPRPVFVSDGPEAVSDLVWREVVDVPANGDVTIEPAVDVPHDVTTGYYRVRVMLTWDGGSKTATSMGHHTAAEWRDVLAQRGVETTTATDTFYVSEAGLNAVPEHFLYVSQPNLVPDFGDFTTPVIRPGERGTYNFTITNRYDQEITGVTVTVEVYMWATIEESDPLEDLDGPAPKVEGDTSYTEDFPSIPSGGSVPVKLTFKTAEDTPKGTYFVRHRVVFTYDDVEFRMDSRGYYTWDEWEGFDYSNLHYQLGTAGIVPDSSFSVKDPVPLWPLATLIALCVLFGSLAVVFYLAEEHGEQYPRLKRGLQRLTGRWEQRKALMRQRIEDLRGDEEGPEDPGA